MYMKPWKLSELEAVLHCAVPVEAEIGKYYETPDYISHTDTRKGAMNTIYHYVRSYMLGRKARLVAKEAHRKTGRLLDIGTGTGYFADTMVRRGWKVGDCPCLVVKDTGRALQQIARFYREKFHPILVGITGSVGKTTTKEMIACVLESQFCTLKTQGNLNNEIGQPKTLLGLEDCHQAAVIEMGMSHFGEISRMARTAEPSIGVITNIGVSHIGNLGSQENICKAKLEICAGLAEGSPLVLNGDDPFLRKAALPGHVRPVWFSLGDESADVCALNVRQEGDGMAFTLCDRAAGRYEVTIPAMGRHNVANALAAYAAATRLGLAPEGVIAGLADFEQTGMRQKVVHAGGMDVIEDCYNANPDSMKAALAMFREYPCKRRFALLGDMLELGEMSASAHEELGRLAAESDLYCLVTYGENAKRTAVVAAAKGVKTLHANNYREAADALLNRIEPGDALLVKASRGMALEKALALFYPVCGK